MMPFGPQDLVAILGALPALKGSHAGAAFAQRWSELEQQKQQREMQAREQQMRQQQIDAAQQNVTADNQRADRSARMQFVSSLPGFLGDESIDSPEVFDQRFGVASRLGGELGVEPGFMQTFRPTPDKFAQRKAKKVVARIESDKRFASHLANPDFAGQIFEDSGERKTYSEWKALAGQSGPAAGSPALPVKSDTPNTPEEQFYATYASELGTSWDKLPTTEKAKARKMWMQADDRPQPQATVLIQTVDANGNPIQQFVSKEPGKTFRPAPSATERASLAEQETGLTLIGDIEATFKPEYVGPFVGRATRAQMATPGAPDVSQDVATFYASVASLRNEIIKMLSGAAVSGSEEQRMRSQLPDVTDKPNAFKAKLEQTKRNREVLLKLTQQKAGQATNAGAPAPGKPKNPFRPE